MRQTSTVGRHIIVMLGIVLALWSPGRSHGCQDANTAMRRSTPPTARENGRPYSHTFSIKITTASVAMTGARPYPGGALGANVGRLGGC